MANFVDFYKKSSELLTSDEQSRVRLGALVQRKITNDMQLTLEALITEEELWIAAKKATSNK
jgi:hypothetical protein